MVGGSTILIVGKHQARQLSFFGGSCRFVGLQFFLCNGQADYF